MEVKTKLLRKIKILNETTWENRASKLQIGKWLENFEEEEQIQALFLLSQFMYFGNIQMRNLLKSLYRDLFQYKIIEKIRKDNGDTRDLNIIDLEYKKALSKTRFLGLGNPSESGPHLLYFFRQENSLSKKLFINTFEIFAQNDGELSLRYPEVDHYVFVDDFCGSGSQAKKYSEIMLKNLKELDSTLKVSYLMLFGTKLGKEIVRMETLFDHVDSVYEFDESFKCFEKNSRIFKDAELPISQDIAEKISFKYGRSLMERICKKSVKSSEVYSCSTKNAHGFGDGQLLVGFHHNTPDNSLPIFWFDEDGTSWTPIFKRYNKIYN